MARDNLRDIQAGIVASEFVPLANVQVFIYNAGTTDEATVFGSRNPADTTPIPQPIITDATGVIDVWANVGSYDVAVHDLDVPARIPDDTYGWEALSGASRGIPSTKVSLITQADLAAAVQEALFQPGDLKASALSTPETGWLLVDGQAVTVAHPALRTKLLDDGSPHGVDGSGNPLLPDLRGRVPVGPDGGAGRLDAADAIGDFGGVQKQVLTVGQLPPHDHDFYADDFAFAAGSVGGHLLGDIAGQSSELHNSDGGGAYGIASTGNGDPVNNMQPYYVINWFVKT